MKRLGSIGTPRVSLLCTRSRNGLLLTASGNWIASTPIPDQSLESRETKLEGQEKQQLLAFVRKVLCWLPEDRKSADQLYDDAFLTNYKLRAATS